MSIFEEVEQRKSEVIMSRVMNVEMDLIKEISDICKENNCHFFVWDIECTSSEECYLNYYPLPETKYGNIHIHASVRSDNIIRRVENGKTYMFVFDSPVLLIMALILTFRNSIALESGGMFWNYLMGETEFDINEGAVIIKAALGILDKLREKRVKIYNFEACVLYELLVNRKWRNKSFELDELCEHYKLFSRKYGECCFHFSGWECWYNKYGDSCTVTDEHIQKVVTSLHQKGVLEYDENGMYKVKQLFF